MSSAAPSGGEAVQTPQPSPDSGQGAPSAGGESQGARNFADIANPEATGKTGFEPDTDEATYTQSKKIKPIKPLPGVLDEGPISAVERARDERGRFVPKAAAQEGAPDREPVPEPPVDPNAPAKYAFAGREWESQAEAEQNYKSLQGQFKPLIEDRNKAAESARGWHQVAQGQEQEIQNLRAELEAVRRTPPPQSQPAQETPPQEGATEIDWELYAEIRKAADAEGNPWKADRWLQTQQQKAWDAREAALRDELTKPFREAQARQQELDGIASLANELAEYVNDSDGQPSFPELRDPESAYMVGRLWHQLGFPPETAKTPMGMIAAVAVYRMIEGRNQPQPSSQVAEVIHPAPPNPSAAAAELAGGRPEPMPSAAESNMDPRAAAIIAGLKKTKLTRAGLGFSD